MPSLFFLLPCLIALFTCAGTLADSPSAPLIQLFSVAANPGEGTLIYTNAGKAENVQLGTETGFYGLAMAFKSQLLPAPYRKDFNKRVIIQVALGTLKSKRPDTIAQFGAVTLIADGIPRAPTQFNLVTPSEREGKTHDTALLLFTSPSTRRDQSDEDKLKYTYFAKSGTIKLTPLDKPSRITLQNGGRNLLFERSRIQLDFQARLATPFNTAENALSGSIQFLLFWPMGKSAESLTTRIASESLSPATSSPGSGARLPASESAQ